ncbi:MAG: amidohydrolase family protein, partial [Alphaproteobacteria bacterium]|nr:amidohydrolase family protein [Alphaproteobacteria bacterium]
MPIRKTLLLSLSLLAFPATAMADTLFQNVTVIDGTGAPVQHNRNVLVKGGRIAAITDATAELPADTTIIYAGEYTLLPTLVNTHGHVGLLKDDKGSPSHLTADNIARHLQQYESYGVSEVLSMGTDHTNAFCMRKATAEKQVKGARLFTTGHGFGVENGAPPASMGIDEVKRPKTAEEARQGVRALAANKPDMVKIWVDDFGGTVPKMTPEVYTAIIEEAHMNGIRVAAHVYYAEDARNLVANGVDVIAHSIRDTEVDDALITDMRERGVTYIPTLSLDEFAFVYEARPAWMDDKFFKNALEDGTFERIDSAAYRDKIKADPKSAKDAAGLQIALKNLKRIHDHGVRVTLGTDS